MTSRRMQRARLALGLSVWAHASACGLYFVKPKPAPAQAVATAADFTLLDQNGAPVSLTTLRAQGKPVVVLFYRGFW
ncbi:MAG: redoxin domain-containing protein [Myxococcales bacterium FL481]|nr:MAG: redoxin domain-containing protein [Myxococcales bacterium FL481]